MIRILVKTGNKTRELEIQEDVVTLGRSSSNRLQLADKNASRVHSRIEKIGNEYRISDLESANGTVVNGKAVTFQALKSGDEIKIGQSSILVLHIDTPNGAAAPAPAPAAVAAPPAPTAGSEGPTLRKESGAPKAEEAPPAEDAEVVVPRGQTMRRPAFKPKSHAAKNLVTVAVALVVVGGLVWGLMHLANTMPGPVAETPAQPAEGALSKADAEEALDAYRAKAELADKVDADLLEEGETLAARYAPLYMPDAGSSPIARFVEDLKDRRAREFGDAAAAVSKRVDAALEDRRYGDAVRILKELRQEGGRDMASRIDPMMVKCNKVIDADYEAVMAKGKDMENGNNFHGAAQWYRSNTARFEGTQYYKQLSLKPENLAVLAKLDLEKALKPATPKPAMAPDKPKAGSAFGMPAASGSAMAMNKPAMGAPAMGNPGMSNPGMDKPAMGNPGMAPPKMAMDKPAMAPTSMPKASPTSMPGSATAMPASATSMPGSSMSMPKSATSMPSATAKEDTRKRGSSFGKSFGSKKGGKNSNADKEMPGPPKLPDDSCRADKIGTGYLCQGCDRSLGKYDVRNGRCKRCDEEPEKIEMCVKRQYRADCHPAKVSDKPVPC